MNASVEGISLWIAPLSLSPARLLSSPCGPASTHTSRGGTSSAVGTSWRLWKKTISKQHFNDWGFLFQYVEINHVRFLMSAGCWNTSKLWGTTSCWKLETPCMTFTRPSLTKCRRRRTGSSRLFSTCSCRRQWDSAIQRTVAGTACLY